MNFRTMALNIRELVPDISLPVIKQRINIRYKQILSIEDWEFLKDSTTVRLRGQEAGTSAQTVAVVPTGVTVTGTGTTFADVPYTGWFFRIDSASQPYIVSSVTSGTELILETAYGGATVTAGTYTAFQTIYSPAVGNVGEIIDIVYQSRLKEKPLSYLNTIDPQRTSTGSPVYWCNHTKTTAVDGTVSFEIWPVPDQDYVVTVNYKKTTADLSADTDSPLFRPELLEAGALWDCYRIAFPITKNTAYIGLARDARNDFMDQLRTMTLEDLKTASLPGKVRDVMGMLELDNNFLVSHDVGAL